MKAQPATARPEPGCLVVPLTWCESVFGVRLAAGDAIELGIGQGVRVRLRGSAAGITTVVVDHDADLQVMGAALEVGDGRTALTMTAATASGVEVAVPHWPVEATSAARFLVLTVETQPVAVPI